MKNKWLIALLVLLVIIVIFFVINSNSVAVPVTQNILQTSQTSSQTATQTVGSAGQTSTSPASSGYVVTYGPNGFSPKTIQVPHGKSVKFINNSDVPLLIVADNNNSAIFSAIDQPKAVNRGGIYTFDFTYTGVWAFHNANAPGDHGNIVVY